MATPTVERTVLPPAEPLEALAAMLGSLGAEPITTLWGPNGEHLVLPPEVFEVLRDGRRDGPRPSGDGRSGAPASHHSGGG